MASEKELDKAMVIRVTHEEIVEHVHLFATSSVSSALRYPQPRFEAPWTQGYQPIQGKMAPF